MRKIFLALVFLLMVSSFSVAAKNLVKLDLKVEGDQKKFYLNQGQEVRWFIKVTKLDDSVKYVDVNLIRIKVGDVNRFFYTHPFLPNDKVIRFDMTSATESSYYYNSQVLGAPAGTRVNYMYEVREPFFQPGAYYYYAVITKIYDAPASVIVDDVISDNSDTYSLVVLNKKAVVSETNYFLVLLVSLLAIGIILRKADKAKN